MSKKKEADESASDEDTGKEAPPQENAEEIGEEEKIDLKAVVAELAKLPRLEFEQVCKQQAAHLGVPAEALRSEVKKACKSRAADIMRPHWNVTPWPQSVATSEILGSIKRRLKRHCGDGR